jgi:hypothetical protein
MQTTLTYILLFLIILTSMNGISRAASNAIWPSSALKTLSFSEEIHYSGSFTSSLLNIKKAFFDNTSKKLTTFAIVNSSGEKSVFSQFDEFGVKQWDVGYPIVLKEQWIDMNSQYIFGGTHETNRIDFLLLNTTNGSYLKYFRTTNLKRARGWKITENNNSLYVVAKYDTDVIVIWEIEILTLFTSSTWISLTSEGKYDLVLLPTFANVLLTYRKPNNLNYISKISLSDHSIVWTGFFSCTSSDCSIDNDSAMIVKTDHFFLLWQLKNKLVFMKTNLTDGNLIEGIYVSTDTSNTPEKNTFTECGSFIFITEMRSSGTYLHSYNQETSQFTYSKNLNFKVMHSVCQEITQTYNQGYSLSNYLYLVGQTTDGQKGIIKRWETDEDDFDSSYPLTITSTTMVIDTTGFVTYATMIDGSGTRNPGGVTPLSPLTSISVDSSYLSTFSSCEDLTTPLTTSYSLTIPIGKTKSISLLLGWLSFSSSTLNLCWTAAGTNWNALSHTIEAYQAYPIPAFANIGSTNGVLSLSGVTLPSDVQSEIFKFQIRTTDSTLKYSIFEVTVQVNNWRIEKWEICSDTSADECKQWEIGYVLSKLGDEWFEESYSQTLSEVHSYMTYIGVIFSVWGLITLGSNPFGIWTLINSFQQYLLIPLLGVYLPGELLAFFLGQHRFLLNFNFLPFEEMLEKSVSFKDMFDHPQPNKNIHVISLVSGSALINLTNNLIVLAIVVTIHILLIAPLAIFNEKRLSDRPILKTIRNKVLNFFVFSFYVRYLLEIFLTLWITTISELYEWNFEYWKSLISSICFAVIIWLFWIYLFIHYSKYMMSTNSSLQELYYMTKDTWLAKAYSMIYVYHRTTCVISVIWGHYFKNFAGIYIIIAPFWTIQFLMTFYLAYTRPFQNTINNLNEALNMVTFTFVSLWFIWFPKESNDLKNSVMKDIIIISITAANAINWLSLTIYNIAWLWKCIRMRCKSKKTQPKLSENQPTLQRDVSDIMNKSEASRVQLNIREHSKLKRETTMVRRPSKAEDF